VIPVKDSIMQGHTLVLERKKMPNPPRHGWDRLGEMIDSVAENAVDCVIKPASERAVKTYY
jgi:hypothetical protein